VRRSIVLWLVLFAVYATTLPLDSAPGERYSTGEVRILLTTKSIVDDGDIDLRNQFRERQWRAFTAREVRPRAEAVIAGRLLEPTSVGLPAAVAPAYALAGARGVELFLAGLLALAVVLGVAMARRLVDDPWATAVVAILGLSPPMLAAATTIAPEGMVAALLAGAAILALRIREETRLVWATWCATFLAVLPWIGLRFVIPGAVIAILMARWLRRRRRGLAGFVALELIFVSVVVYITIHDRLYGGLTPDAVLPRGVTGTGADSVTAYLHRLVRPVEVWLGAGGLLWWAPATVLAGFGVWRLYRSRRERLWKLVPEQVDTDVTAGMYVTVCGAGILAACLLVPVLYGVWFPAHDVVPVFAFGAALAAWGAARQRRVALVLLGLTLLAALWFMAGGLLGDGVWLHPAHGPLSPWQSLTGQLPD